MKMTPERRAEARARCDAATPELWYAIGADGFSGEVRMPTIYHGATWCSRGYYANAAVDANFIAAARQDLPAALDDIDALVVVAEAAEAALEDYEGAETWAIPGDMAELRAALAALREIA